MTPSNRQILETVCAHFDVTTEDVLSGCKSNLHCHARWTTAYFVNKKPSMNGAETGRFLNLKPTATLHANRRINELMAKYAGFAEEIKSIERQLNHKEANG